LLAAVAAVSLLAGCGGGKHVYVQGSYKPKTVVLGAGTPIRDVQWITYGGETARGHGMFGVNDCQPTCASGHVTSEPTAFTVSYRGPCKGKDSYRLISIPIRGLHDFALEDCGSAKESAPRLQSVKRIEAGHGPHGVGYFVTETLRFRACGATGDLTAEVEESKSLGDETTASEKFERPLGPPGAGCASYHLTWRLSDRMFGAGEYTLTLRVRNAEGKQSKAVVMSDTVTD
jgi:hypothetical protein